MTGNTEVLLIYGDVVTPPKCTLPAADIYSQFICTPAVAQQKKDMKCFSLTLVLPFSYSTDLQWRPFSKAINGISALNYTSLRFNWNVSLQLATLKL